MPSGKCLKIALFLQKQRETNVHKEKQKQR
nr:MAG TPA: hypothetical protein [Caudoviricetes sp.]